MKIMFAATLFALAGLPLFAQQTPTSGPPNTPATQQPGMSHEEIPRPSQSNNPAAGQETSATPALPAEDHSAPVVMSPVSAQLLSGLDSKTAKTGDDIVVETGASVKTADGTEIPKGSKLVGHVLAVRPSGGQNSQVVLQFDQAELKNGQKLPIRTEIQSIAPPVGESSHGGADATPSSAMNGASADNAPGQATSAPANGATASRAARGVDAPGAAAEAATSAAGASETAAAPVPAAGTIVSRNGKIAIRTTLVPGVLLANNAPGEQDPRMAQAAGILVGTQRDIQLAGGTQIVIGVASAPAKTK